MIPPGRVYADPGDRLSGRYDPPRLCTVLTQWGRGGGPRNVAVRYLDNGQTAVIPFSRRLRLARDLPRRGRRPANLVADRCGRRGKEPGRRPRRELNTARPPDSPAITPARNAFHSVPVNCRTGPEGCLLLRTATPPPGTAAASTQLPFAWLNDDFRHASAGGCGSLVRSPLSTWYHHHA